MEDKVKLTTFEKLVGYSVLFIISLLIAVTLAGYFITYVMIPNTIGKSQQ